MYNIISCMYFPLYPDIEMTEDLPSFDNICILLLETALRN